MIKFAIFSMMIILLGGCTSHSQNPNERMMDKVIGELDRETSK